jgi:hypothetical protein
VLEGPGKQQNHSDNYEHLELPITPETDVRTYHRARLSIRREFVLCLAKPQEKFSVEPGIPLRSLLSSLQPETKPIDESTDFSRPRTGASVVPSRWGPLVPAG